MHEYQGSETTADLIDVASDGTTIHVRMSDRTIIAIQRGTRCADNRGGLAHERAGLA